MKVSELSAADQRLLKTDLGEFDKVAAQQYQQASDCYNQGFEKFATEAADAQDEADEMDKQAAAAQPVELTPEQEKVAAELGAITEKGFFDGLCKLGSDRHGDEMHYLWPYIEQKIAQEGAQAALEKAAAQLGKLAAEGKAENHYGRRALLGNAVSGAIEAEKGKKLNTFGKAVKHQIASTAKGTLGGAAGGGALGAAIGAARGAAKGGKAGAAAGAAKGARMGAHGGAQAGYLGGAIHGSFGRKATEIHNEHSKNKK